MTDTMSSYDIGGTDLGNFWDNGAGEILTAFGDTYSNAMPGGKNWRCNSLLQSDDTELSDGIEFSSDVLAGLRSQQTVPSEKNQTGNGEHTAYPTSGIAIDGRQYVIHVNQRVGRPRKVVNKFQ